MSKILKGLVPFAAAAMFSGVAGAGQIIIDTQVDYDNIVSGGDADSMTAAFSQMGVQFNSISTVVLTGTAIQAGDVFTDTGYGIIDPLLGFNGPNANEGLNSTATFPQLTFWFDDIQGQYVDVGGGALLPAYTGGTLHFMFDAAADTGANDFANSFANYDPFLNENVVTSQAIYDAQFSNASDSFEILTVSNLFGGPDSGGNFTLLLNGEVSFAAPSWLIDATSGGTFDSLLNDLVSIAFQADFNDDNGIASSDTFACEAGTCVKRYSDHNGSASFQVQVPAPGVLALMGLGLFGMGAVSRKRSKKAS